MTAKCGVLEQTQGLHLHAKFHLNAFVVSASGGQIPQFWANFDFLEAPVPTLFYRYRLKFGALLHGYYGYYNYSNHGKIMCCGRYIHAIATIGLVHEHDYSMATRTTTTTY